MYMLVGPNGAGKSTLYETRIRPLVPDVQFINADIIQRDELKDASMQASYKAAEIAESRRRSCLADGTDFVSESTFSHESKLALVKEAKDSGFRVVMYHVNVRSADISVKRVASRLAKGGHDVPEHKIRERYVRNQALIKAAVLQADRAYVYDNSDLFKKPEASIKFNKGRVVDVYKNVPPWARELYAKELESFSLARLNPGAASFADAKAIVEKIGGPAAVLHIPNHGKNYAVRGEIVGEAAEHWVQKVDEKTYVAHFKRALAAEIGLHRHYQIAYPQRGRGVAEEIPQGVPARAHAFRAVSDSELSRDDALRRHPELRPAFNELTVAKLKHADEPDKLAAVQARLQARLNAGEIPAPARAGQQLDLPSQRER